MNEQKQNWTKLQVEKKEKTLQGKFKRRSIVQNQMKSNKAFNEEILWAAVVFERRLHIEAIYKIHFEWMDD